MMSRLDDANTDLNASMQELADERTMVYARQLRPLVRVLGSIAVTLAMMLDHMKEEK